MTSIIYLDKISDKVNRIWQDLSRKRRKVKNKYTRNEKEGRSIKKVDIKNHKKYTMLRQYI